MYRQHFGLTRLPFEAPAHSAELFASEDATETGSRLQHLLELRCIGRARKRRPLVFIRPI